MKRIDNKELNSSLDAEWMRLELIDQMTRTYSGGKMLDFLKSNPKNEDFVISRCGEQVKSIIEANSKKKEFIMPEKKIPLHLKFKLQIKKLLKSSWFRDQIIKLILRKSELDALLIGRFHLCGEKHKYMYDRISLANFLKEIGFVCITRQTHITSLISNWNNYLLDNTISGSPRKPDSLYMEAIKPS